MNIINFRDLGGLTTTSNKKIKNKKLLRSGELVALSDKSKTFLLHDYQLKKIIDMRGTQEITERPDDSLGQVKYQQIDILKNIYNEGASFEDLSVLPPEAVNDHMKQLYQHLVVDVGAQEGYRDFLKEIITTTDGSLLFHCFAGKDRTGVGAALVLKLLDIPDTIIMDDYLKTNVLRKRVNQQLINEAKQNGMSPQQLEGLDISLTVKPEYLISSYTTINKEFGGIPNYVKEILQFSPNDIEQLKNILLEDN